MMGLKFKLRIIIATYWAKFTFADAVYISTGDEFNVSISRITVNPVTGDVRRTCKIIIQYKDTKKRRYLRFTLNDDGTIHTMQENHRWVFVDKGKRTEQILKK